MSAAVVKVGAVDSVVEAVVLCAVVCDTVVVVVCVVVSVAAVVCRVEAVVDAADVVLCATVLAGLIIEHPQRSGIIIIRHKTDFIYFIKSFPYI